MTSFSTSPQTMHMCVVLSGDKSETMTEAGKRALY